MSSITTEQPPRSITRWRLVQVVTVVASFALLLTLILKPHMGVRLFWNLVIPVVPALALFVPGWWRNACPLGTVANLGQRNGRQAGRKLSLRAQGWLSVGSVVLLATILPARHLFFDLNGHATAALLIGTTVLAMTLGWRYAAKSGWCGGLCPVQGVERLYGQAPAVQTRNAQCSSCSHCVAICADSMASMAPRKTSPTVQHRWTDTVLVGGFVGFVWGWFQVADVAGSVSRLDVLFAYAMPFLGALVSGSIYLALRHLVPDQRRPLLVRAFAAAAISCYYWFRVPALLGMGHIPGDGVLLDCSAWLPEWTVMASRLLIVGLLGTWLLRQTAELHWSARPATLRAPAAPAPITIVRPPVPVRHDTLQTLS